MLRISLALRLTKSLVSVTPSRTTQIRWFRKEDDDGGAGGSDDVGGGGGGGSWVERERALEGVYIRKLDYENMQRLRKRLAKKRDCKQKQQGEREDDEKTKHTDEAEDED